MNPKNDFDFYLKCTKPLVLDLPKINDRILSAAWIKRILNESVMETKINCLKLLLFVLQKKQLCKPFDLHPNNYKNLSEFQNFCLQPITNINCENDLQNSQKRPFFVTDCSANQLEYVAAQEIPKFGTHVYYAFSNSPIPEWHRAEKGFIPKPKPIKTVFEDIRKPAETNDAENRKGTLGNCNKGVKMQPPIVRIGTLPESSETDVYRLPPVWGSNLCFIRKNI